MEEEEEEENEEKEGRNRKKKKRETKTYLFLLSTFLDSQYLFLELTPNSSVRILFSVCCPFSLP